MTNEQIQESLDLTYTILRSVRETLQVQGKNIQLSNDVIISHQKRINNLEQQVKALVQNTHTHSVVYGHMQKPDNFDTTGVVE